MTGPTAAGKTEISLAAAGNEFEIISCDSVQVFRYLDIGSGKTDEKERDHIPHFCIDIVDPDNDFSAGEFVEEARKSAGIISSRGKIPLFVGGTGFYIDAFFKGLSLVPTVESTIRKIVEEELKSRGAGELHRELMHIDPLFGAKVHENDHQRIVRGLSVYRSSGRSLSSYYNESHGAESNNTLYVGLFCERDLLINRINLRVDAMMKQGFLQEVESLRKKGYGPELKSMQSIGYRELNKYIDGEYSLDEAVAKIKFDTRKYAKRQMTWFKRNKRMEWFHLNEKDRIVNRIHSWLERNK